MATIIGWTIFIILAYGFYHRHHASNDLEYEINALMKQGMTKSQAKQIIMREYEILGYTSGDKLFKDN
jgi:hypothetical protein